MKYFLKHKWHFIFWFCDFWYGFLTDKILQPETHIVSAILYFFTHVLFLFYSYLFLLNYVSQNRIKKPLIVCLFFIDISFFALLRYVTRFEIIPAIGIPEPASMDIKIHFTNSVIWMITMFCYAIGYFYFTSSIKKERQLRIVQNENQVQAIENMLLQQRQLEIEKEKIQLENTLLRAQINPHFLFNTLGYFYNEISELHPHVGEGIAALADIMRSVMRKPDVDGLIPLNEEVCNIEQLIGIYQLRYNNNLCIFFNYTQNIQGIRILPHILTTLVENGLKHGEIHDNEQPFSIQLVVSSEFFLFKTNNKKRRGPKELSHGIGMRFLRAHLDTVYKNCYHLLINENETTYAVELKIEINHKTFSKFSELDCMKQQMKS